MANSTVNQAIPTRQYSISTTGSDGLVRMNSEAPAQKVMVTTLAAATAQLLIWLNNVRGGPQITLGVSAALTVLETFAVGYLTPPGSKEEVVHYIDPRNSSTSGR